jgi:hypothetical protein
MVIDDVRGVQNKLEDNFAESQNGIETTALSLYEKDPAKAVDFLTNYSCMTSQMSADTWKKLGEFLIVKYNDGVIKKTNADGTIMRPLTGNCAPLVRKGYPESFLKELVKATGDRYKVIK